MADKKFELEINSKATGNGLDQTARKADVLAESVKEVNRSLGTADGSQGLQAFLERTADKARATEVAFYDLDAKIEKATRTTNSGAAAHEKLGDASKGSAMKLLFMGQAIDDLQYGVRGVLNNIPQLVMAFGGGAGLAGAISIAAVGLSQLSGLFDQTDEKAQKFEADMAAIGRNAAANILDKLNARARELEQADQLAAIDRQPDKAGQEAADRAAQQRFDQLRSINEASTILNQLLERQTSVLEEIRDLERQRAEEREAAAAKAIRDEEAKVKAAREAVSLAQSEYDRKIEAAGAQATQLMQAREELELIRKKRDELVALSKQKAPINPDDIIYINAPTREARAAKKELPNIEQQVAAAESKRDALETAAEGVAKAIDSLYVKIYEAEKKFREQSAASQQNIDGILRDAGVQQSVDQANVINQGNSVIITRLQEAVNLAEGQTGVARDAADSINKALSDGKLTLREMQELPTQVQLLAGTFKGEVSKMNGILSDVVEALNLNASRTAQLEREVSTIKSRAATPGAIR